MGPIHTKLNALVDYRNSYNPGAGHQADDNTKQAAFNSFAKTLEAELDHGRAGDLGFPSCPHSIVQLFVAQHLAKVNDRPDAATVGNIAPLRMRNFYCMTVGLAFTLLARILRVVIKTIFLPLSLLVSAYQQSNYGPHMVGKQGAHHIVVEDLRRYSHEWIDLGVTLSSVFIALAHTIAPRAITLDGLRDYYISRLRPLHLAHPKAKL